MKYRILMIAAAGLALMALPAAAQGVHRSGGPHGGRSLLETFDRNGDGSLNQEEVDQFRADRLAKFDTNGDGQLTLEEYQALWLDAMRERMVDAFQRLDDDGDAMVTREEFLEPFAQLVQRLDRDADGTVTREEMRAQREEHRDRRGAGHGRSDSSRRPPG